MYTLFCTENEMATKLADTQLAAITATDATTAVPLASWPRARGAQHCSVRLAQVSTPAGRRAGKQLNQSIDAALAWCE